MKSRFSSGTATYGNEIVLSAQDREKVRNNGVIDSGPFSLDIKHDFVRAEVKESVDLPSLLYFFRVMEEVLRLHRRLYVLAIISPKVPPPPPENRRCTSDWDRRHGADALAIVAPGNPMFLLIMNLVFRAINAFRATPRPRAMFPTETEARAWLEAQRQNQAPRPAADLFP